MTWTAFQSKFQRIRDNKVFELFVISVIILSSLLIGVRTYNLPETVLTFLWVMDYAVTVFF